MKRSCRNHMIQMSPFITGLMLAAVCWGCSSTPRIAASANPNDAALKFLPANSAPVTLSITVDGKPMAVTRFKVCYAAKPVAAAASQPQLGPFPLDLTGDLYSAQSMYIYVPAAAANDQKAPIYLRVDNSGWHSQPLAGQQAMVVDGNAYLSTTDTDSVGAALKAGYVIVQAGTRSRGFKAADGSLAGKAPAPVVDTKAIVRYLRLNDAVMPGSAERIILNGTSGGGGLTSVVAASGNCADYYPYLAEIGAAGISGSGASATSTIKDDVFAAVAYCPINNFANADAGYEWEFNAVRTAANTGMVGGISYGAAGDGQRAASAAIKANFAPYFNGLKLRIDDKGTLLTDSNLPDIVVALVKEEIERKIATGVSMPSNGGFFGNLGANAGNAGQVANDWLTVSGTGRSAEVTGVNYTAFQSFKAAATRLKNVVAFDATGVSTASTAMGQGESDLFGRASQPYCNFMPWTWSKNDISGDGIGTDDTSLTWSAFLATADGANVAKQLKMISAVDYLTGTGTTVAPHWYIRHGMIDRDTAQAVQVILYYAVKNNPSVKDVSFKLPYMTGHSGNYDVQEVSAWIARTVKDNPLP